MWTGLDGNRQPFVLEGATWIFRGVLGHSGPTVLFLTPLNGSFKFWGHHYTQKSSHQQPAYEKVISVPRGKERQPRDGAAPNNLRPIEQSPNLKVFPGRGYGQRSPNPFRSCKMRNCEGPLWLKLMPYWIKCLSEDHSWVCECRLGR